MKESKAEEKREDRKEETKAKHHRRARGGKLPAAFVEEEDGKKKGPHQPAHHPRKRGGHVPGKPAKGRPDRRARGGATSDQEPTTTAGKMSTLPYEKRQAPTDAHSAGPDKD